MQDEVVASTLLGMTPGSDPKGTEQAVKDLHLGYAHKKKLAKEKLKMEESELECGKGRRHGDTYPSHLKHADDYNGAKDFKHSSSVAADHVNGVKRDSIGTVAGMVRELYTSRGKNYKLSKTSPRRAALLLRWVNNLDLQPIPVTLDNLHASFCSGLLLADLVRCLIPPYATPGGDYATGTLRTGAFVKGGAFYDPGVH